MTTTALATTDQATGLATIDRGYLGSADVLARVTRILEVQKSVMREGVHYGTIPGTPKPTLLKPGAEKLLMTFQIAAVTASIDDLSTSDEVRYRVRVQGVSQATGAVLGESVGECSSNEEKYRWRKPVCKQEFDETPPDQKREVWKKKYNSSDFQKVQQVRTSPADVANTILQMATKRGLIPMTRVVLACSDIFDQDLEDMPAELRESLLEHGGQDKPKVGAPQRKSQQAPATSQAPADQKAPAAATTPGKAAPSGTTTVASVTPKNGETNGRKWILYIIKFDDGREASTLDETIARAAMDARDAQAFVRVTLEPGKKEGSFQLTEIVTVGSDAE